MANFEAFRWNFSSSTKPEIGRSGLLVSTSFLARLPMLWVVAHFSIMWPLRPTISLNQGQILCTMSNFATKKGQKIGIFLVILAFSESLKITNIFCKSLIKMSSNCIASCHFHPFIKQGFLLYSVKFEINST